MGGGVMEQEVHNEMVWLGLRQFEWDENQGDTPFGSANAAIRRHNREVLAAYKIGCDRGNTDHYNPKLYEKMKKILPPEPEETGAIWGNKIDFKHDSIRYGTDAFASSIGEDFPRNYRDFRDTLYVFGKFMFKEMERQVEYWRKTATDALYLDTRPIYVDKESTKCELTR